MNIKMGSLFYIIRLFELQGGALGVTTAMLLINGHIIVLIAFLQLISILVLYGKKRFCTDIEFMKDRPPSWIIVIYWYLSFIILFVSILFLI